MAYSSISKPSLHFNTKLYSGTGSSQNITGVGFQPDWTWIKNRSTTHDHILTDAVRGVTKDIRSNNSDAEATDAQGLTAFGTDGFTVGTKANINTNGSNIVSWNWLGANGTASNPDGSITSTVSANTTAGFSIVSYTGNGTAGATIGHGLGSTPSVIFVKGINITSDWSSYHSVLGNTGYMRINNTNAFATSSEYWNNTSPSSSVFTVGTTGNINGSGNNYVAYCFAEKKGYSKFGSYTGNGNADGTFIYTGFKPAWVIFKGSSFSGENWDMYDNKRETFNVMDTTLKADSSGAESSNSLFNLDFLSNGIKLRNGHTGTNQSGQTHIYMAFAEEPLVANVGAGVPATAR